MSKREMIERALDNILDSIESHVYIDGYFKIIDALAEQAIVIGCEAEHRDGPFSGHPYTAIRIQTQRMLEARWVYKRGIHGTPGKAIAIIVSLGEER